MIIVEYVDLEHKASKCPNVRMDIMDTTDETDNSQTLEVELPLEKSERLSCSLQL